MLASDRQDLERLFRTLNERIAFLMKGGRCRRSIRNCRPPIPASSARW
jgi:deferrochelatase/peroxidase EfeB